MPKSREGMDVCLSLATTLLMLPNAEKQHKILYKRTIEGAKSNGEEADERLPERVRVKSDMDEIRIFPC